MQLQEELIKGGFNVKPFLSLAEINEIVPIWFSIVVESPMTC